MSTGLAANHHLTRARSQHFVSSPRKSIVPIKHKLSKHASKRRRVGSTAFAPSRVINITDDEDEEDEDEDLFGHSGPSRLGGLVLNLGQENRPKGKARARARVIEDIKNQDVFTSGDDGSPKKRKRGDDGTADGSVEDGSDGGTSSSWVEMEGGADEDEGEPEFIAESDQHLLHDAPASALHRLKRAELVRLWKVAGMWTTEDEESSETSMDDGEGEDDLSIGKKELVDGLIAARRHSADRTPSSPPPSFDSLLSPRKQAELDAAFEFKRLRSSSSLHESSASTTNPPSSSDDEAVAGRKGRKSVSMDVDATPKAAPRTRGKSRRSEGTLMRSVHKRDVEGKGRNRERDGFRGRSKSMVDRKARFGDDVKSPGKALGRRERRSSTNSSAYTTTDNSSHDDGQARRATPRHPRTRRKSLGASRRNTPRRPSRTPRRLPTRRLVNGGEEEVIESTEGSEEDDPTPLVQRLRSRSTRASSSFVREASGELDADAEEDEEADGEGSPTISQRTRSKDRFVPDSDISMDAPAKKMPTRGAKKKAMEALKGGESDAEMEIDEADLVAEPEQLEDADEAEQPVSGRTTRSQAVQRPRNFSISSLNSSDDDDPPSRDPSLTPLSPTPQREVDMEVERDVVRQTRSGKAFGIWQDRKRRLRQEAIDDPDMDVDGDEGDDVDEDEEQEEYEADVDLTQATQSSLVRLLRDELVLLCEARGIEVEGTKPRLAKALLAWRDEQMQSDAKSTTSSQATARPSSSRSKIKRSKVKMPKNKIIHAVASNVHRSGQTTPVLLRDHIHATDPATPPHSDPTHSSKKTVAGNGEAELNLDLSELGLEDSMIKPAQLVKLEKIGSGGFKDVYVGKLRGRKVAVSEFREHLSDMDIRELKLLAEFSHPNIVKFRGICIPEDNSQVPCMLVSELCENGDLFDYIRNVSCPPLKRVLGLMLDIARGLEYLHTRDPAIIHRDCKSSNILINRAGQAKVGDFGLARVKHSTRSMIRSLVGTVNWQAPELWHPAPRYDYKVDIFSAAMVYWEMMSGWIVEEKDRKYPWEGHNEHYIYDVVGQKHRRPSIAGLRKHWGDEPVNLMERMWCQDPGERPTMTDVVADLEVIYAEA